MPRGFGMRGFGGWGPGMRRRGFPLLMPMSGGWGWGGGSPLLTTLMAGGLGYMMGSNSGQQAAPQYPQQNYPQYPHGKFTEGLTNFAPKGETLHRRVKLDASTPGKTAPHLTSSIDIL